VVLVVIADGEESVRRKLAAVIAQTPDIILVGEGTDGLAAARLARRLRPDAVVIGADIHAGAGTHAVKTILSESPSIRIVVFANGLHAKDKALFLEAGAEVCISKSQPMEMIVGAIRNEKP
jgi:DNA-binding NarL/FixJ family response regulator